MIGDYVTRILGTFGDVNPIDHGGGYIYARKDNPSDSEASATAEIEYIEPPTGNHRGSWDCPTCEGNGTGPCESPPYSYRTADYQALRCDCETCDGFGEWVCITCKGTGEDPSLRWEVSIALVEPYDWIDWKEVASYTGQNADDYRKAFASGDRVAMAHAIIDAAAHDGWHAFDSYPLQLTRAEIEARCAALDAIEAMGPRMAIGDALACAGYAAAFTTWQPDRTLAAETDRVAREFLARNPTIDRAALDSALAEARKA